MKETIKIARSATGQGTTVTVTLLSDGITASYGYKSAATKIGESVKFCRKEATGMLRQAREEVDS